MVSDEQPPCLLGVINVVFGMFAARPLPPLLTVKADLSGRQISAKLLP